MTLPLQGHCNFLHSTAQDWCLGVSFSLITQKSIWPWARTSREHIFSKCRNKFESSNAVPSGCFAPTYQCTVLANQTPVMAFGALSRSSADVVPAAQKLYIRFRTSHCSITYCKKRINKTHVHLWSYFLLIPRQRPSELLWRYNDYQPAQDGSKAVPKSLSVIGVVELAWIFCRTQEAKSSLSPHEKENSESWCFALDGVNMC